MSSDLSSGPSAHLASRIGAILYLVWGAFHVKVAHDIYLLGLTQQGIAQGRTYQLAAYLLTLSLFVIAIAVILNWRNSNIGFWLNLCVAGWADLIWTVVVVLPGYVSSARGFIPPAIFVCAAVATWLGRRMRVERRVS
ncbi:MAG TPA: hypothetical protein VGI23_06375 [Steroidobacteraceae bacterium]